MAAKTTAKTSRMRKLNRRGKKRAVKQQNSVASGFSLMRSALKHIWASKRIFGLILLTYLLLSMVFVRGLAITLDLDDTRASIEETLGDEISTGEVGATLLGALLGSAGTTAGEAASVYQLIFFIVFSLVIIWTLRLTFDKPGRKVSVRQAFYQSMYPLIPYILVGLVIMLQLIPALIGVSLYSLVISNDIAVGGFEQFVWFLVMLIGLGLSIYWVSSSIFASYIATLPESTPMGALRSARKLVKYRRWSIIRKLLFLPLVMFVLLLVIFFPLVLIAPMIAEVLFIIVSLSMLVIAHAYIYVLYRELL